MRYFIDTTLGEGVKEMVCVFDLDLEAKMTVTIRPAVRMFGLRFGWAQIEVEMGEN